MEKIYGLCTRSYRPSEKVSLPSLGVTFGKEFLHDSKRFYFLFLFFYIQSPHQVFVLLCFDGLIKNNT